MPTFDPNRRFQKKYADDVFMLWVQHRESGMLPTSARFLFYELVALGKIDKKATGNPGGDVSKALLWLRTHDTNGNAVPLYEDGIVPWSDIADETRTLHDYSRWATFTEGVEALLSQPILDPWRGRVPMIITESRSLAGVIESLAYQYRCMVASTNGQCGGFLRTDIIPALQKQHEALVLYLGDFDRQGADIENNTRCVIQARVPGVVGWERLLLTQEQAAEYGLTANLKYDKRDGKSDDAIEAEALNQSIIMEIVQARLVELLPEALEDVAAREDAKRQKLLRYLRRNPKRGRANGR